MLYERVNNICAIDRVFSKLRFKLPTLILGCLSSILATIPARAAERVSFSYGLLEFSVSAASLETYAQEGRLVDDLAVYAPYFKPDELAQLRQVLQSRADLSPVIVSRLLQSSFGRSSLQYLGEFIQTDAHQNGFYALRSALVLAAADPEGLTLLNVIKKFPTRTLRLNSDVALQSAATFTQLFNTTEQVTALIEQQSASEAKETVLRPDQRLELWQAGSSQWQKQTLNLKDDRRNRQLIIDLYLPSQKNSPLLVISHGLASDRTAFADLAQHLASHGFAVAAIEHPGSNQQQLQNLLKGLAKEVIAPNEFVDRPLDISYLLDELQRLNQSSASLQGRLELQRVGMIGHSFGGYTAFALAGAKPDLTLLQQECSSTSFNLNAANLSMLLQCSALDASKTEYDRLADPRIQAIFVMNPIGSSIFGERGINQIQTSTLLVAGSDDAVAPVLLEQACPFVWLTQPNKYLVLIQKGTHTYDIQTSENSPLIIPTELANPDPVLARLYFKTLGLAFFKTHIATQLEYRSYLSASYVQSISQSPLQLRLVRALDKTQLYQSLNFSCLNL